MNNNFKLISTNNSPKKGAHTAEAIALNVNINANGAVESKNKLNDITVYSSCMNLEKQLYYYNTYNNLNINVIDMKKANLNSKELLLFEYKDEFMAINQN